MCIASENEVMQWYKGWAMKKKSGMTVCEAIQCINAHGIKANKLDKCFVMPVSAVSVSEDKCTVSGKVEHCQG